MSESSLKAFRKASRETLGLLYLNLKVKAIDFMDYLKVIINYYSHPSFLKIDTSLLFSYLFHNPYKISKRFLLNKGAQDIYAYGETPLTTLEQVARECRLSPTDTVFGLGCGRGRSCFWLNQFIGCRVVGVDYIPEFIERATLIKNRFNLEKIEFRLADLLEVDLKGATAIYLYGTCYSTPFIQAVIKRFTIMPKGTKIITVSYSLNQYTDRLDFEVMKRFPARFTWGTADVYLQIKK